MLKFYLCVLRRKNTSIRKRCNTDRIDSLHNRVFYELCFSNEFYYLFYKRYSENLTESEYERYSDAFYYAFSNLTPDILEGELIVGKYYNNLTDTEKEEWQTCQYPDRSGCRDSPSTEGV